MNTFRNRLLVILLGLTLLAPAAWAQPTATEAQAIYDRASPSVAIVRATTNGQTGLGTAFVIDPAGILATASHVARQADRLIVDFGDGGSTEARLLGYDARRDLAILRVIPRAPLSALDVADSSSVHRGDPVIVIGNPRGRPRVMTTGVVRATSVTMAGQMPEIFIMFDAQVAPGNSGGPLLNDRGQVIGVVVAGTVRDGVRNGLAVSSTALRTALPRLLEGARFERAWMGIAGVTAAPDAPGMRQNGAGRGVLILEVVPRSPAERAGLRGERSEGPPGDVIVSLDGEPITEWEELLRILGGREPGQRVRLGLYRGVTFLEVTLMLDARP